MNFYILAQAMDSVEINADVELEELIKNSIYLLEGIFRERGQDPVNNYASIVRRN